MEGRQASQRSIEHTLAPAVGNGGAYLHGVEGESSERKRTQEELSLLTEALEKRLSDCQAELAAARERLGDETEERAGERVEIGLLNEKLALQCKQTEILGNELESLTYSISHDLRAPLRHILGFSSALLEDYGDQLDCTAQGFLGCVTKAAQKLEAQIDALLSLSRVARQQIAPCSVDLSELARELAARLQEGAPERHASFKIADDLKVQADPVLLKAALEQLLGNAWKFTRGRERAEIEIGCRREGGSQVFFVRDNGVGFDMRYAGRLFGAFQRMHQENDFEGGGIGLATVQRIIHRHGGKVWAEAAVDSGATFYFTLGE